MLRRLLAVYMSLLVLLLPALEIPLAVTFAARDTQAMFIDRLNDTARFASLAEPALRTGELSGLRAELARYDRLYGIPAAVVDRDARPVIASRSGFTLDGIDRARLNAALSGEHSGIERIIWPWQRAPLVVAEPVGRGGEVIGATLTVSPTRAVRHRTIGHWAELAVAGVAAVLLFGCAAVPLSRWVLRPVRTLDEATGELSAGRLRARAPVVSGPPELRRLAEHFNTMAEAMARNLELQRSFVSYASHQLRNPLGALRLRVENLGAHLTPGGEHDLELAVEETDRLARILDGLLALVRAEGGNYRLETVDCGRIAAERVAAWQATASAAGVRLRHSGIAHAGAQAVVDGVGQILDALIDNAIKFTPPLRRDLAVRVDTKCKITAEGPGEVWVEVEDDGPGLTAAERAQATQRFWRGPAHQNIDGTGLGLTIARVLAEASGGRLELLPGDSGGLRARLVLPAAALGRPTTGAAGQMSGLDSR